MGDTIGLQLTVSQMTHMPKMFIIIYVVNKNSLKQQRVQIIVLLN